MSTANATSRAADAGWAGDDPLHDLRPTRSAWTTVNAEEALPGVATPLGASWMITGFDATRLGFADIGAISVREARAAVDIEDQIGAFFFGRFAMNVDFLRRVADQMPGSSGDAVEEKLLGSVRPGVPSRRQPARLPLVLVKFPLGLWRAKRRLAQLEPEIDAWWRAAVAQDSTTTLEQALAGFRRAEEGWRMVVRRHGIINMVATGAFEVLQKLCGSAGHAGLEYLLVTADRDVYEAQVIADLWQVAHGRVSMENFLGTHGYHGPRESELSSRSWREDPAPLHSILERYRAVDEVPIGLHQRRAAERRRAEAELFASLGRSGRVPARAILRFARAFVPLKEASRSTFLKTYDGARCMARRVGAHLVQRGALDSADDVFFLTSPELDHLSEVDLRARVAYRKSRRNHYLTLDLPQRWEGTPTPLPMAEPGTESRAVEPLTGIGVSSGVVEGRALVVADAAEPGQIADGDILVCHTTDPSWASLMFAVSGCVIDVGSAMSHGAIVAREIGIPCVVNTRRGTSVIHTGDRIVVDGSAGTVTFAT
jgi:pyruvate,water dikinase